MRKLLQISGVALAASLATVSAQADVLGFNAEIKAYSAKISGETVFTDNSNTETVDKYDTDSTAATQFSAAFEHPIPILPNVRVALMDASFENDLGTEFDQGFAEATLYYELLDTIVDIDFGLTARVMDLTTLDETPGGNEYEYDSVEALGYLRGQVELPLTGLGLEAIVQVGENITDYEASIKYKLSFGLGFAAGYRVIALDIEEKYKTAEVNFNNDFEGAYLGIYFDI